MTLSPSRARQLLDLPESGPLTREVIVSSWRKKVREHHTDHGGSAELALEVVAAKSVLLDELENPAPPKRPEWKTGKGGRPPLVDDLVADKPYGQPDLDLLVRSIQEKSRDHWLVLHRKLGFRVIQRRFVEPINGTCIYTHPSIPHGERMGLSSSEEIERVVLGEILKIRPEQVLTLRLSEKTGPKHKSWILWKTQVRCYHSMDFFWTLPGTAFKSRRKGA